MLVGVQVPPPTPLNQGKGPGCWLSRGASKRRDRPFVRDVSAVDSFEVFLGEVQRTPHRRRPRGSGDTVLDASLSAIVDPTSLSPTARSGAAGAADMRGLLRFFRRSKVPICSARASLGRSQYVRPERHFRAPASGQGLTPLKRKSQWSLPCMIVWERSRVTPAPSATS